MKVLGMEIDITPPTHAPVVLLVEDNEGVRSLISAVLAARGASCDTAGSLAEARELLNRRKYNIVFIDVNLPDGSGLSLAGEKASRGAVTVVITGRDDIETAVGAIRAGASDFIPKPFTVAELLSRFDRAQEEWRTRERMQDYARILETLVRMKSEELLRSSRKLDEVCDLTVASLGAALNLKDNETAGHCERVMENSARLGALLSLSASELRNLTWGSYLHDVGKIGIPETILLKPGPLTAEERRILERHPLMGFTMLRNIEFLADATDVVISHHEKYDGSGYPHGLRKAGIPLNARIFAVLDALDAMTSRRPYRQPIAFSRAALELERMAGRQFDPEIVKIFLRAPASTWLVQERDAGEAPLAQPEQTTKESEDL